MTIGSKFRARGWSPLKPVLVIPGLCSSCLVVTESPYDDWKGKQIWLNLGSIGFDKILLGNVMRNMRKRDDSRSNLNLEDSQKAQKRKWMQHMRLKADGISDPDGIKVRAMKGLKGCAYLEPHSVMHSLSYVMGPLFDTLKDAGYTSKNLKAAPYDWRLSPRMLEERDMYFTELKQMIQQLVADNKQKVVVLAHSLGTRVFHYFLLWIEDTAGRSWIDEKIDLWIPVGPLWLGAPKSIRATVSGERMGLEDFLYPEEGIELTRFASSAWMFPTHTPDFEFQEYSFLRDEKSGQHVAKNVMDIMRAGEVAVHCEIYDKHYKSDKYFVGPERLLKAPPIEKMLAIYGVNLKTETFFFFKKNTSNSLTKLELDPAGQFPNYVVEGGIAYETKDTKQNMLKGKQRSGDGTVPYASLAYCKKWRKDGVKVRVEELEAADHRVILRDKRFHRLVLEAVCRPPPLPALPARFQNVAFEVVRQMGNGQQMKCTLRLTRKGLRVLYTRQKKRNLLYHYQLITNISVDDENSELITVEVTRETHTKHLRYLTPHRESLARELVHRCNFVEEGAMWEDEVRNELGQTELHRAAMANKVDRIYALLQEGADVNAIDNNCFTPLHAAASLGNLRSCLVLLQETDVDVEKVTADLSTVLHFVSAFCGHDGSAKQVLKMLDILKSKGADLHAVNQEGDTCLHASVRARSYLCAHWLVQQNANVNCANRHGYTPLHIAIMNNDLETAAFLLSKGADKHKTTRAGKSAVALSQGIPRMQELVSGTRPTPLPECAVPASGGQAVDWKAVDEYGQTALHRAAFENDIDGVFDLLGVEVDVNAVDRNGWTALHCAASKGFLAVLLLLLTSPDLDVTLANNSGATAMHYLVRHASPSSSFDAKRVVALEKIKARGASIDAADRHGETPLHQAARRGNLACVDWLLSAGANVNALTSSKESVLHYAVQSGKQTLVERVLQASPDLSAAADGVGTAWQLARKLNIPEVAELLDKAQQQETARIKALEAKLGSSKTLELGKKKLQRSSSQESPRKRATEEEEEEEEETDTEAFSTSSDICYSDEEEEDPGDAATSRSRASSRLLFTRRPSGAAPPPPLLGNVKNRQPRAGTAWESSPTRHPQKSLSGGGKRTPMLSTARAAGSPRLAVRTKSTEKVSVSVSGGKITAIKCLDPSLPVEELLDHVKDAVNDLL